MVVEHREYGKKSRRQQCVTMCIGYTYNTCLHYELFKLRNALSFIYKR